MKNTTRIICITLCVLLIALSAAGVIWALYNKFASNEAHADYEDLAGTDTLVNFNQLITNRLDFSNTTTDNRSYFQCAIMFNNGVWYSAAVEQTGFFDFIITASTNYTANLILKHSGSTQDIQIYSQNFTITNGHKYYFRMNVKGFNPSISSGLRIVDFIVIDLSLMFGVGNEPNLQQAKEYFTAEYYSYNSGTPIPYSKDYLQGYADGANDVYDSMTITYNSYSVGSNSAVYSNNTIDAGTFAFDNQYGAYTFSGVISLDLQGMVERGTNFSIDFELYIPDLQGESASYAESTYFLHFAYVDSNNVLNDITTLSGRYIGSWTMSYQGSFVLPTTTSTLYIYVDYTTIGDNTAPTQILVFKSDMSFKSTDLGLLMNNSYQRGYNAAAASYYQGTENYNAIYNLGYQNGLAQQDATLGAMEYIGAAFTGIGSILAIELLPGVPFSLFILLPLMFGLIAFVVKLSKGGD